MFVRIIIASAATLSFSGVTMAQDTIASGTSELPGLESEFRVEIPGLSRSECLKQGFALKKEMKLDIFEDPSTYLIEVLHNRGTPFDESKFLARFEKKGGWSLSEDTVNDAYCNATREELASSFGLPLNSSWRELVNHAKK